MHEFSGKHWDSISTFFELMKREIMPMGFAITNGTFQAQDKASLRLGPQVFASLRELHESVQDMGLLASAATLDRLLSSTAPDSSESIQYEDVAIGKLATSFLELQGRLRDELRMQTFLSLNQKEKRYYEDTAPFGVEVNRKFPVAAFEIEEASKCMALERYTAATFHLMRAVEHGLCAVRLCLGLQPLPAAGAKRNWGGILTDLRGLKTGTPPRWPEHDYFSNIYALLDATKDGFRNGIAHADFKFTESEAETAFNLTRGMMQKIASRMDENGLPLAQLK